MAADGSGTTTTVPDWNVLIVIEFPFASDKLELAELKEIVTASDDCAEGATLKKTRPSPKVAPGAMVAPLPGVLAISLASSVCPGDPRTMSGPNSEFPLKI